MYKMKEVVILRILAQKSPKSELRLQRYGEMNFEDLFVISGRGISRIIFENQGSSWKFGGCCLITKKSRGLFTNFPRIIAFRICF
jgi:hypothetical protein